jgi:HAD superfamily hydrolase (TIGR01459 family)
MPMSIQLPAFIDQFRTLATDYDVVLCDVWGVVHNGVDPFADACEALTRFRAGGGAVVLLTNAPRPNDTIVEHLDALGVRRDVYDAVVTSGDVTRAVLTARPHDSVFHLGPQRDLPLFGDLGVRVGTADTAAYAVCTGLFDDTCETPDDYRPLLGRLRARSLFMVCANPDLVVVRGQDVVYCAGAIAALYEELGGDVLYAGKPHRPIYELAVARAAELHPGVGASRVLAIGDSVRTDLTGAVRFGVDCLFVNSGIHGSAFRTDDDNDAEALSDLFGKAGVWPRAVMPALAW